MTESNYMFISIVIVIAMWLILYYIGDRDTRG